jgi:hypothetical protein
VEEIAGVDGRSREVVADRLEQFLVPLPRDAWTGRLRRLSTAATSFSRLATLGPAGCADAKAEITIAAPIATPRTPDHTVGDFFMSASDCIRPIAGRISASDASPSHFDQP